MAIIGGTGFVGTNFALHLVRSGRRVDLYDLGDRLGRLRHSALGKHDLVRFHIVDASVGLRIQATPAALVNCAAWAHVDHSLHERAVVVQNNVMSLVAVLEEAMRLSSPVLFMSSVEVYGGNMGKPFVEASAYGPLSPYAASKVAGEALVAAYSRNFGLEACIVRLTNLYGPWQAPDRLVPRLIAQRLCGHDGEVERGRLRDFVYVEDAVRAFDQILTAEQFPRDRTFNVSSGRGVANEEVAAHIAALIPSDAAMTIHGARAGDGRGSSLVSDSGALRAALQWAPTVGLAEGLDRCVGWYRDNVAWWKPFEQCFTADRLGPEFLVDYPTLTSCMSG